MCAPLQAITSTQVDVRELDVGPLDAAEAQRLALARLEATGPEADAQARRIADEACGSPFFIDELARHVRDGELASTERVSLDEVLRARLRRLPPDAARLLSSVALASQPLAVAVASRAAEVGDPAAIRLLQAGNLVRTRGAADRPVAECYHDRIRQAALVLLGPAERKLLHGKLAAAIESSAQPDAEALAHHHREAGELARAAACATKAAAHAAETLAFDRAARLYRLALELEPGHADARALRVNLGEALVNAGRGAEAAEAYLLAATGAEPSLALDLRRRAAGELLRAGHIAAGVNAFRDVLAAVELRLPETARAALASLLWNRARLRLRGLAWRERDASQVPPALLTRVDVTYAVTTGMGMVDSIRGAAFEARQLRYALDAGEPHRILRAFATEASFLSIAGTRASRRTQRVLQMAEALARRLNTPEAIALSVGAASVVAFQEGQFARCLEASGQAEQLLRDRCTGLTWEVTTAQIFHLFALSMLGDVRRLSHRLPTLVKEAQERGNLYAETNLTAAVGYIPGLIGDDPLQARAALAELLTRWKVDALHLPHVNGLLSEVYVDLYEGRPDKALARLDGEWARIERSLLTRAQVLRIALWFARGRARLGAALARLVLVSIAELRGRRDEATTLLGGCDAQLAATGMRLHLEAVRWLRGQRLSGDEGRALRAEAEAWFTAEGIVNPQRIISMLLPGIRVG